MENKFERIIENLEEEETLIIGDQTFLNEMILDESIQCSILGTLTFFEVDFKRIDFTGSTFVNCEFKNCRFKDVILRKCEFWNPTFENCQIERSNLTRANFHKGTFRNCNFLNVNLRASYFSDFEFIETKFNSSDLDLIGARSIKVWKLNHCTEIEESSNFGNLLEIIFGSMKF
jgi:uncharacterized protein YjbI with pentapeptide repeats